MCRVPLLLSPPSHPPPAATPLLIPAHPPPRVYPGVCPTAACLPLTEAPQGVALARAVRRTGLREYMPTREWRGGQDRRRHPDRGLTGGYAPRARGAGGGKSGGGWGGPAGLAATAGGSRCSPLHWASVGWGTSGRAPPPPHPVVQQGRARAGGDKRAQEKKKAHAHGRVQYHKPGARKQEKKKRQRNRGTSKDRSQVIMATKTSIQCRRRGGQPSWG